MSSLPSLYPAPSAFHASNGSKIYDYDLRLEVGIDDSIQQVAIHDVFVELLRRMTDAADSPVIITDIQDGMVTLDNIPEDDEFKHKFSVEMVDAKTRKMLLGFKLKTPTPLSVLKHRMFDYLRENMQAVTNTE